MIAGEAPEIRGTIPGWLQVRPGCTYRNKITGAGRDRMAKVVVFTKIRKTPKHSTSIILRFTFRSQRKFPV